MTRGQLRVSCTRARPATRPRASLATHHPFPGSRSKDVIRLSSDLPPTSQKMDLSLRSDVLSFAVHTLSVVRWKQLDIDRSTTHTTTSLSGLLLLPNDALGSALDSRKSFYTRFPHQPPSWSLASRVLGHPSESLASLRSQRNSPSSLERRVCSLV